LYTGWGGTWSNLERQAQVVGEDRSRLHALIVARCRICNFTTREVTVGVLTGLTGAEAESTEVVEVVALYGRVSGELSEEASAARLDGKLAEDRIFHPHQPGHRVDQQSVGDKTVEQNCRVHVEDVIDSHGAVELALVVAAGGDTFDGLQPAGALAGRRLEYILIL
jgi:hypothetical protein